MKRLLIALLIATVVFIGCSSFSYKARHAQCTALLSRSDTLNMRAVVLIDSLQEELDLCRMKSDSSKIK